MALFYVSWIWLLKMLVLVLVWSPCPIFYPLFSGCSDREGKMGLGTFWTLKLYPGGSVSHLREPLPGAKRASAVVKCLFGLRTGSLSNSKGTLGLGPPSIPCWTWWGSAVPWSSTLGL